MKQNSKTLITGASGNVGRCVINNLSKNNFDFIVTSRKADSFSKYQTRILDFEDATTYNNALEGITQLFLMRPPALSNVKKYFEPFLDTCKTMGVEHIVFLSLQGADANPFTPHHKIEEYIKKIEIPYTFIRPSFFMQNLTTTHLAEIKNGELFVPAGNGKTNFIDTRDIGAVIAKVLMDPSHHFNKAYEITGQESFTYHKIAEILSKNIGYSVAYVNPNPISFLLRNIRAGKKVGFVFIMLAIYSIAKAGKASRTTTVVEELLGRKPIAFTQFVADNLDKFRR